MIKIINVKSKSGKSGNEVFAGRMEGFSSPFESHLVFFLFLFFFFLFFAEKGSRLEGAVGCSVMTRNSHLQVVNSLLKHLQMLLMIQL